MASLTELTQWEASIYQLETTDPVKGGNDGISNLQGKQLANRTAYLKQQVELKAPIASPTFTGVPAVPTAAADTSTTQAASTAFVVGQAATAAPIVDGVAAVGTSKKFARQDHVHPTDTTRAPVASPTFTGVPAAPTAAVDTSTTQVASTAFVIGQAATVAPVVDGVAAVGTSKKFARQDHVHPTDTTRAPVASPTFTGVPAAPTAAVDTSTTQVASTAFVIGQAATVAPVVDGVAAVGTSTKFARQDHVHPTDTTRAPVASPTFTGVPAVPTAAADTNTTQAASTAFVLGQVATVVPVVDGVAAVGTSTKFARQDHVHPTDTSRAPVVSPTFTGVPVVPTAAADTNTTQVASTAFVLGQVATAAPVVNGVAAVGTSTKFARQDHVHPIDTTRAPVASPTFTGVPAVPTATADTNTTQVASTAFVLGQAATVAPIVDGVAAVGTSTKFARQDHVHPVDTKAAPPGEVAYFAMSSAPTGWIKCNGAAISRTTYAALFTAIGTTFGAGDGSTTFNVPDLRGEFLRGFDDGRGVDSSRVLGAYQSDLVESHRHAIAEGYDRTTTSGSSFVLDKEQFPIFGKGFSTSVATYTNADDTSSYHSNTTYSGGTETRPRNIALLACIKY